jgi:hypothetical protein
VANEIRPLAMQGEHEHNVTGAAVRRSRLLSVHLTYRHRLSRASRG